MRCGIANGGEELDPLRSSCTLDGVSLFSIIGIEVNSTCAAITDGADAQSGTHLHPLQNLALE
jgi:hypothetical protein